MGDIITAQKQNWLTEAREAAIKMESLRAELISIMQNWTARGYATGAADPIVEANFAGTIFEGMTAAQVNNVASTFAGFETWFTAGQDDNISKITP